MIKVKTIFFFQHGDQDLRMKDFDQNLMETCEFLRDVTESRAACLKAFVKCGNMITWLKESMNTGEQAHYILDS